MLDPDTYRVSERLAKAQMPAWQIAQTHAVDHFERVGFPVRVTSIRELGPLLDTMQENRFALYMRELGGLTVEEYELILDSCRHAVLFQLNYFPQRDLILPISTLLSVFCLYKKLLGIDLNFRSVLELGPGCGYLSYLLRHHEPLENYSQIEACESFYLLQNLVNIHCFGPSFEERAFVPQSVQLSDYFVTSSPVTEFAPNVRARRPYPRCTHYPWWRIGELISRDIKFQVVTSNANLLEFSPAALEDYLTLIDRVLQPDGVFLVQCMGYPSNGSIDSLLGKFWDKGFALLAMPQEHVETPSPRLGEHATLLSHLKGKSKSSDLVMFTVNNALLVKAGHPLFQKYRDRSNYRLQFVGNEPLVDSVFFARPSDRKMYTMRQFVEDTEKTFLPAPPAIGNAISQLR
jgi:hypothetical protein